MDVRDMLREKFLKKVREKIKLEGEKRDLFLSHVSKTIEDLDKTVNLLGMRLREWYTYYFPEFEMNELESYFKVVTLIDDKKKINVDELAEHVGFSKAKKIAEQGFSSSGGNITKKDLDYIKRLAQNVLSCIELKKYYEDNLEKIANEIAPNATFIAGGQVTAKLIAHAGGIDRLASMPASTIQVLGAEKALFKYLKKQSRKPPKHGILLLHNYVSSLPKKLRGKMARSFAAKLSIAFKADSSPEKHFIGKELKKSLDKRYSSIKGNKEK